MSCNRSNVLSALRFAADQAYSVADQYLALHRDSITLVIIKDEGVDVYGEGGTKTKTETRITLGDGYISTLGFDGYINPKLTQVSAKDIFLSGGQLTDKDFCLGPIVFPYTYCGKTGGFDITLFNPDYEEDNNFQLYFHIVSDFFPNGAYFKRIWSIEDSGISFKLYIRNTGVKYLSI